MNQRSLKQTGVLILLACAASLCACVSLGRPFVTDNVKSISIGKTTQADITNTFGIPFRMGSDSGDTTWTYVDYHFGLMGPQRATDLVVKFNADGTVKSYSFNSNQ